MEVPIKTFEVKDAQKSVLIQCIAEYIGSLFLASAAISPMILFPEILGSEPGVAVIADAIAVCFVLAVLIEVFYPISGAHFNPLVSMMNVIQRKMTLSNGLYYCLAQLLGGFTGLITSHLMFYHEIPILFSVSSINRGGGCYLGEIIGTFILILSIKLLNSNQSPRLGLNVGLLVGGQLLATSSTMFANPMITLVRTFTYSAAGISPRNSALFIAMQIIGTLLTLFTWSHFVPSSKHGLSL